jgi:L-threonylcarbamoyladenylate synthase
MKRLTINFDNWGDKAVSECVSVLKNGGIVVYPTETCYGLGVDIFNQEALQKLYTLKKMPAYKPVSVIVTSPEDAKRWGEIDQNAEDLMKRYWPGPYTFIVGRKGSLPQFFNKGINKVGFRNPSVLDLLKVVEKMEHPVTTTSANLSGRMECYEVSEFLSQLKGEQIPVKIDLVLDAGEIGENPPSTVYDCVDEKVLRGDIEI